MVTPQSSIFLNQNLISEYIATVFSPNLVATATLYASGSVSVHPIQCDPSLNIQSVVLAQKFTNALKKQTAFDDIYLVAEQYINEGNHLTLLKSSICEPN